ncbi:DUF2934 domain-containing protein [Rhodoferax sp. 4810]|nr:DUF2934 domain-containing protein [Rhodoferax jenense]
MDHLAATHSPGTLPNSADSPRSRRVPVATDLAHPAASAAYFKAQAQGFSPGEEMHDWLQVIDEISHRPR